MAGWHAQHIRALALPSVRVYCPFRPGRTRRREPGERQVVGDWATVIQGNDEFTMKTSLSIPSLVRFVLCTLVWTHLATGPSVPAPAAEARDADDSVTTRWLPDPFPNVARACGTGR